LSSSQITIQDLLQKYSRQIDELLEREMPRNSADFLSEGVWYQFSTGGKRLRPALCLLTCEQLGGDPNKALPFAMAAEILHNFLLIHDDIEDGDTLRRDQKTLWAHLGVPNAINVGDYLISNAYRILLGSPVDAETVVRLMEIYSLTFERTVEGQALDINWRGSESFTVDDYFRIVQLKTAYYLTFNLVGGAIVAGFQGEVIDQLWELGRHLGPAFQIRDDVIDLTCGKGRGGEIGCDIREGKPSILFAHALDQLGADTAESAQLLEIIRKSRDDTTNTDVEAVLDLYRRTGALEFAENASREQIETSFKIIDRLPLESRGKELFRDISQFMVDRQT
jgi:geranylgeranyl pyrophosphate synthase